MALATESSTTSLEDSASPAEKPQHGARGLGPLEQRCGLRLVHHIDIVRDIVVENETRRHHAGDHEPRAIVRISHTAVKFSQLRLAQWRELRVLRRPVADACVSGRGLERREATQTVHQREPLYWPGAELL